MTTYFHSSPTGLAPGSVIQPGNFGRILSSYTYTSGNAWFLARELAFETVRATHFPNLPSRFTCSFVFERSEDAIAYQGEFTPWNTIYEVELASPDAVIHRGGFNLVKLDAAQHAFLIRATQNAELYWMGRQIETAEIITTSGLRVVQTLMQPSGYQPSVRLPMGILDMHL